jgi:hypothetical protein
MPRMTLRLRSPTWKLRALCISGAEVPLLAKKLQPAAYWESGHDSGLLIRASLFSASKINALRNPCCVHVAFTLCLRAWKTPLNIARRSLRDRKNFEAR